MTLDGSIGAGSVEKPARTPMKLNLKSSAEEMRKLDGLRMNFRITGPDKEHLGVCLNRKQGIRMENMKITFQGAVTTEL